MTLYCVDILPLQGILMTLWFGSTKNEAKYTNKCEGRGGSVSASSRPPRPPPLFVYLALFFVLPFQRVVGIPYSCLSNSLFLCCYRTFTNAVAVHKPYGGKLPPLRRSYFLTACTQQCILAKWVIVDYGGIYFFIHYWNDLKLLKTIRRPVHQVNIWCTHASIPVINTQQGSRIILL